MNESSPPITTKRQPRVYVTISEREGKARKAETMTLYGVNRKQARKFIEDALRKQASLGMHFQGNAL